MSGAETTVLGAIAGATIFLGLPLGRVQQLSPRVRNFLAALSAGILLFIFWDVTGAAAEMVENALLGAKDGGSWGRFLVFAVMGAGGLALGALSLAWLERAMLRHRPLPPMSGGSVDTLPAGVMGVDPAAVAEQARRAALALGMLIAIGIGVHNFSEGLAIGVASKSGEIALAGTLIIGFALHNATEGFGIVGPLAGHAADVAVADPGRRDRRRSHVPGNDGRLPGVVRAARARLPGGGRGRDPVRDRRAVDGRRPPGRPQPGACPGSSAASCSASPPISSWSTPAPEPLTADVDGVARPIGRG